MSCFAKARPVLLLALLLLMPLRMGSAQTLAPPTLESIERLLRNRMAETMAPGISIAIALDNQLVYSEGFGVSDLENEIPVTPETRFRTASIAKPMTAVLVMSLSEDGFLDVDEAVQTYCPEFPTKQWPVTSRQLLGHLGGIRHYKNRDESIATTHYFSTKTALRTYAADPLRHEPGTEFLYTTFGYNLLGAVAEGAGERNFEALLQSRVLTPAGMTHTVADDHFALIPNRTRGYVRATESLLSTLPFDHDLEFGHVYNAPLHDTSMKVPGGGLLSTSADLVRFAIALNTGLLVKDESRLEMWTPQKTTAGTETEYGLGWFLKWRAGRRIVSHGGGQAGTSTILWLVPETGTAVAIMCNLQRVALADLAAQIADLVQPPPPTFDYDEAIERLQAAVQHEVEQKQLPAFSIALTDDQRLVWADGFGHQDDARTTPATAETVYRVGSVSKLFTDIAVLQLVEQGKLDLDQPVQTYLPDFQPSNSFDKPITLRQLMSHRSGLVRESPVGNYFDPEEPTLAEAVASLNDTSLVYAPNRRTKYSNAAIAVVGAILEKQFDSSHPEQVRRTIFAPLGMDASSFVVNEAIEPQLATGWMRTYDGRRFEAPEFLLGTGPAGNLYSSVLDLSKFLSCLFREVKTEGGQLLNIETLDLMTTPVQDEQGRPQGFGLGFHVRDLDGNRQIGHGGAIYGFSTQLEALPERRLGVVAAASLDGTNGVVERLTEYALRLMLAVQDQNELPEYRLTTPIPPERASELVGDYREVSSGRLVQISELDGRVYLHRGVLRHELRAAADNGDILTDDETSFGTEVKIAEGGRIRVGGTLCQPVDHQPPPETQQWRDLIGEYGWDHNVLYILEQDGQLYALIEWFYYYPLKEIHANRFAFPDYGLYHGEELLFYVDANGDTAGVVAAEVQFPRREVGTKDGETFRITPVRPIDDLRAGALSASPPEEAGDFREPELVDLARLDPTIKLDIRYATTNNFTGSVFYQQPRAFMQRPAAEAVVRAHQQLKKRGLGLLIHDAYRPWHVTKMFWDATPEDLKDFVANPANGSRHNRGCAVDLTLYDLDSGQPIEMVAGYDEFSPRSFPLYPGGTSRQRWYRELLRRTMEAEGFTIYEFEWWHFDYQDWRRYRIGNSTFEELE